MRDLLQGDRLVIACLQLDLDGICRDVGHFRITDYIFNMIGLLLLSLLMLLLLLLWLLLLFTIIDTIRKERDGSSLRFRYMLPYSVDIIVMVSVHPHEVLLDVVGSIELLVTDIALKRLFIPVDIFMAVEKISSISSIWTVRTRVPFGPRIRSFPLLLHFGF